MFIIELYRGIPFDDGEENTGSLMKGSTLITAALLFVFMKIF